jgi:hypothetical protein
MQTSAMQLSQNKGAQTKSDRMRIRDAFGLLDFETG